MKKAIKILLIIFLSCLLVLGAATSYFAYLDYEKAQTEICNLQASKNEASELAEKQKKDNETLSEKIKAEKENNKDAIELQESWERIKEKLQKALQ